MAFETIADVRAANAKKGHHFFDRDTMRFFNSRIESSLYGGRYFVTSEQWCMTALMVVHLAGVESAPNK